MKKIITFVFGLFLVQSLSSQSLEPCGTPNGKSKWLKKYQANPGSFEVRSGETLYVPMSLFLVGKDDGVGIFSETKMVDALCTLSKDFEGTDIHFYLKDGFNYLYNSSYYEHGSVLKGAEMMFDNNIDNTINSYVVLDPAGNCGYNLPYAGIALAKSCTGPTDHTWAHEIGHNLSLPHPFLGWEGGVSYDNSVNHNFNNPAPDSVLYDYTFFQDTLILDTLIIDTVAVEKLDGSNCTHAADGFCDTKPDYLAQRWQCDSEGKSLVEQTDPNGEKFFSSGDLFMSYAFDGCSNSFSNDQIDAMRANLINEKASYLDASLVALPEITETTTLLYPADGEITTYDQIEIAWEPVENAEYYIVQLGIEATSQVVIWDTLVSTTSLVLPDQKVNDDIYWRIKAINSFHFCGDFSENSLFVTTDVSAIDNTIPNDDVLFIPNLTSGNQSVFVKNKSGNKITSFNLFDIHGQRQVIDLEDNVFQTGYLQSGIYYGHILLENNRRIVKKLIVQ